jgi:hypothetical protein
MDRLAVQESLSHCQFRNPCPRGLCREMRRNVLIESHDNGTLCIVFSQVFDCRCQSPARNKNCNTTCNWIHLAFNREDCASEGNCPIQPHLISTEKPQQLPHITDKLSKRISGSRCVGWDSSTRSSTCRRGGTVIMKSFVYLAIDTNEYNKVQSTKAYRILIDTMTPRQSVTHCSPSPPKQYQPSP